MLQTERLIFAPFAPSYFPDLFQLFCKNEQVMASTLKNRPFTTKEFMQLLARDFIFSNQDTFGFYCLLDKDQQEFVGVSGLLECYYLNQKDWELGFILKEAFWGKGLATEIGNFWVQYAQNQLHLSRILATVRPDNHASKRVLQKLGMQEQQVMLTPSRGERAIFVKEF